MLKKLGGGGVIESDTRVINCGSTGAGGNGAVYCPKCEARLDSSFNYCPYDGAKLKTALFIEVQKE